MVVFLNALVFCCVGLALALFGGGGAMILIPYLKQALEFPVDQAALLSLITIGTNTGIQTIQDRKAIAWTPVLLFSLVSFPVASLSGQFLAPITSDTVRMILFGVFTLSVALMMMLRKNSESEDQAINLPGLGFAAVSTGIICGLVGVGGGIFITPALIMFYGMSIKESIRSSLAIVALQSIAALGAYLNRGVSIEPTFLLLTMATIAIGFIAGKRIKHLLPDQKLKQWFSLFLLVVGTWVLIRP